MNKKTIVVIEDNQLNMKLLRGLLNIGGFAVLEAEDAENGIQLIEKYKPDLILMDIQLPHMDGLEATRIIKHQPSSRDIPVIAISAHAMEGDKQKAFDAGCNGYITKPIETRCFLKKINIFLEAT